MKIPLEIEVPEEVVQLFAKDIKEEVLEAYIKELIKKLLNDLLAKLPETYAALKSGVLTKDQIFDKGMIIGSNIGDETRRQFKE